jgi:hypothetical protein
MNCGERRRSAAGYGAEIFWLAEGKMKIIREILTRNAGRPIRD